MNYLKGGFTLPELLCTIAIAAITGLIGFAGSSELLAKSAVKTAQYQLS